jgi:tetratricopeptide (TPR) repeat protein
MIKHELDPNIVASARTTGFASAGGAWQILVGIAALALGSLIYLIFFNKDGMDRIYARECTQSIADQRYSSAIESCSAALAHRDLPAAMRAGLLYHRANAYMAMGTSSNAVADLTAILEEFPSDQDARFLRAHALNDAGDPTGAINDIKIVLDSGARESKFYDLYAHLLTDQGKFTEAAEVLKQALIHHPDDTLLMNRRAYALINLGDYHQALTLASEILQEEPANPYALFSRVHAWIAFADFSKARVDLNILLDNDSKNSDARALRAYANLKLGALDAARTDIVLANVNAWTLYIKERILMDQGYSAFFAKALKLERNNTDFQIANMAAWISGRRYLGDDGVKELRAQAEQIRQDAVLSTDGGPMLCLVYGALADFGHAKEICDEAIAVAPKNGEAWRSRAFLRLRLGSFNEALADWQESLAISPEDAIAHFGQGYTLLLLNQVEAGRKSIDRARSLNLIVDSYFDRWGIRIGTQPQTPQALIPLR